MHYRAVIEFLTAENVQVAADRPTCITRTEIGAAFICRRAVKIHGDAMYTKQQHYNRP